MAGQNLKSDEWVRELDSNAYGVRLLTLHKAYELAAQGYSAGWYISPFALKWTVGRMARDGRRYHVTHSGEPLRFENMADADQFLVEILRLTAAPKVSLAVPPVSP
jgi:hypothetical protein